MKGFLRAHPGIRVEVEEQLSVDVVRALAEDQPVGDTTTLRNPEIIPELARVIDDGVKLVGEDHVALGSDFDGGPPLPRQIKDVSDYPEMTKAMMATKPTM